MKVISDLEKRLAEARRVFKTWPKAKQDAMRSFVEGNSIKPVQRD